VQERLEAIREQFERAGFELTIAPSTRGERGSWSGRYRSRSDPTQDDVAYGNTELEAAELALRRLRDITGR
jgi:hypothetical protein